MKRHSFARQQKVALSNPCQFAEQCSDPRYFSSVMAYDFRMGVGITVNVGEE